MVGKFQFLRPPVLPAVISPKLHHQLVINIYRAGDQLIDLLFGKFFHMLPVNMLKTHIQR